MLISDEEYALSGSITGRSMLLSPLLVLSYLLIYAKRFKGLMPRLFLN
jgi:hypothetical protein